MSQSVRGTLLVTGGAGFIGSNFVEKATERGYRVVVLDLLTYSGHRINLEGIPGDNVELVVGDICDRPLVRELLRRHEVDALINFAAESHVDRSIENPDAFVRTNVTGTYSLLDEALDYWKSLEKKPEKKKNFRYVQISTDEVFGSLGAEGKFSETSPIAPNSPYSASKSAADQFVRAWHHTYGLPTITTHCSNNYGPKQFPEKLIPYMITCALGGRHLPVYGDGKNIRDWIHVWDHCHGIMLALERGKPGSIYCFGGNEERKNIDLVRTICKQLDIERPRKDGKKYEEYIQFVTDRLGHDRRYAIDDTLAQRELGFTRRFNFESGLADTVRWYLNHANWSETVLGARK